MAMWTLIELVENGAVSEDDGETAWRSTDLFFGWPGAKINVDVHVDWYSFKAEAHVKLDDFGLPGDLLARLAVRLYWLCSPDMLAIGSDLGAAECDIEAVVREHFYHGEADSIIRKLRAGIAAGHEAVERRSAHQ